MEQTPRNWNTASLIVNNILHGMSSKKLGDRYSLVLAWNELQETGIQSFFDCKQSLAWNKL
jgi:hypothetical protein